MATIKEVAVLADVSASTVSNVLNGRVPVREKTRRRVLDAVQQLGYVPNSLASNFRRQETNLVAFCVGDIANPANACLARAAGDVLREEGYHLLIFNCDESQEVERDVIQIMSRQRVAGALIIATAQDASIYQPLLDLGIQIVCVDRAVPSLAVDVVRNNDVEGFRRATQHLLDQGHRRIGFVAGPIGSAVAGERLKGYLRCLAANGIPADPELILEGPGEEDFGFESLCRLMLQPDAPTAVLTTGMRLTLGVLYAIDHLGLKRPEDIDLVGSVGRELRWLSLVKPPVTVIAQPTGRLGSMAAEYLVARLRGFRTGPAEEILVEPEIFFGFPAYGHNASGTSVGPATGQCMEFATQAGEP